MKGGRIEGEEEEEEKGVELELEVPSCDPPASRLCFDSFWAG